jgi:hypothetical protein
MKNGKKYKTAEKREEAFNKFCRKNNTGFCKNCPLAKKDYARNTIACRFLWLELEANEEK